MTGEWCSRDMQASPGSNGVRTSLLPAACRRLDGLLALTFQCVARLKPEVSGDGPDRNPGCFMLSGEDYTPEFGPLGPRGGNRGGTERFVVLAFSYGRLIRGNTPPPIDLGQGSRIVLFRPVRDSPG